MDTFFLIGANVDQAKQVYLDFQAVAAKVGATVTSDFNQVTGASRQMSGATNDLTGFIRQQRQETFRQSFVFRELSHIVGGVSVAFAALGAVEGNLNEQTKTMLRSLQEGFFLFQGLNFVLAAVPAGTFIAAIAGIGTAILGMSGESEKAKKTISPIWTANSTNWNLTSRKLGERNI